MKRRRIRGARLGLRRGTGDSHARWKPHRREGRKSRMASPAGAAGDPRRGTQIPSRPEPLFRERAPSPADDAPRGCAGTGGTAPAGGRHVRLSSRRRTGFGCRRRRLKSRGVAWLHGGFVRRLSVCVCADESGPPFQIGRNIGDGGCGRDVFRGRLSRRPILVGRERSRKRRKSLRRRQFFALLRQRAGR